MEKQPETHNELLGKIASNFSNLELVLSCFVTKLISDDSKIGTIVTAEMSFQNLLKAFYSLTKYKIKDIGQLNAIDGLIKRLNTAEQERNAILHSAYLKRDTDNENEVFRIKVTAKQGKGLKITKELVDVENLKQKTKDLVEIMLELESIHKSLYNDEGFNFA